jgi:glucosamine-6-phosphate deaminase
MEATRVTPLRVFDTPESLGSQLAGELLERIRRGRKPFLLGCPTGRTPRPIYDALAGADLSNVIFVMMDEYLVPGASGLRWASEREPWSCHSFVQRHFQFQVGGTWFPDPADPAAYDRKIADAGGIDLFLLASGASDGHVAFNSTGSSRESRTRVVPLSEATRRDNLQTFPSFGTLENVPRHGVTVGIDTIARARESIMVVWGASKRVTLQRMLAADRYDPEWPATVIHESAVREIIADAAANAAD